MKIRILIGVLALASLMVVSPAHAKRGWGSIDCDNSYAPVETYIYCTDTGLKPLDDALNEAYKAKRDGLRGHEAQTLVEDERRWLARRNTECPVPVKAPPTTEDIWKENFCLASLYRERLDQLSPNASQRFTTPYDDPAFIHPLCLELVSPDLVRGDDPQSDQIDIDACNRGYSHIGVIRRDEGWIYSWHPEEGWGEFGYRLTDRTGNGNQLAIIQLNTSGRMIVNAAVEIKQAQSKSGNRLIGVKEISHGGDRCSGGEDGGLVADLTNSSRGILLDRWATPKTIIESAYEVDASDATDCYECCAGTIRFLLTGKADDPKVVSVKLRKTTFPSHWDKKVDICFEKSVEDKGETLDEESLRAAKEIFMQCVKSPDRP